MSVMVELKYNVGDTIKRVVHRGANMTHGCGISTQILKNTGKKIIAGSPINRDKRMIYYTCYNETKGRFETLSERDIEEYDLI